MSDLLQPCLLEVPERVVINGAVYALETHPDDLVQVNVHVPCRLREALRAHAADRGLMIRDVVADALAAYLKADDD